MNYSSGLLVIVNRMTRHIIRNRWMIQLKRPTQNSEGYKTQAGEGEMNTWAVSNIKHKLWTDDGAVRVDFYLQQHHFLNFTCASFPTSKSLSSANVFRGGESCLQISHLLG